MNDDLAENQSGRVPVGLCPVTQRTVGHIRRVHPRLRDSRLWDFVPCQGPTSVCDYIKVRLNGHCLVSYSSFS